MWPSWGASPVCARGGSNPRLHIPARGAWWGRGIPAEPFLPVFQTSCPLLHRLAGDGSPRQEPCHPINGHQKSRLKGGRCTNRRCAPAKHMESFPFPSIPRPFRTAGRGPPARPAVNKHECFAFTMHWATSRPEAAPQTRRSSLVACHCAPEGAPPHLVTCHYSLVTARPQGAPASTCPRPRRCSNRSRRSPPSRPCR